MDETKSCNICTEDIKSEELVTLICNPNHHFCYTCIFDWYNIIKHNTETFSNNNKQCTCPICKKDGGTLPLLPPHTEKILGIHIKGNLNNPIFGGFGSNQSFGGSGGFGSAFGFGIPNGLCKHKDCNHNAFQLLYSKPDVNHHIKTHFFCVKHYYDFKKGKHLILNDDTLFESTYIQCSCKMPDGTTCTIANQNITHIHINNKNYYLCNNHKKLYNHGIQITFDDNVKAIFKPAQHFVKNVCCTPNKSKYGYCLNYINYEGLCKTKSHNKNMETLNDSGVDEIFEPNDITKSTSNKKVMNVHIGLCGVALKNGNGNCQNKGKAEHNGKCGKHKNS